MWKTASVRALLRGKLVKGLLVIFVWLLAVELANVYALRTSEARLDAATARDVQGAVLLAQMAGKVARFEGNMNVPASGTPEDVQRRREELQQWIVEINTLASTAVDLLPTATERSKLADFSYSWNTYVELRLAKGMLAGQDEERFALGRLDELQGAHSAGSRARAEQSAAVRARDQRWMLVLMILALGPAMGVALYLANEVSAAATAMSNVARVVAAGDANLTVKVRTGDELESLAESFNRVTRNMRRLLAAQQESAARVQSEIHGRRRTEETLSAERKRFDMTLRLLGEGVIMTDTEGLIVSLNRGAEGLTGWTHREAMGRPLEDVFRTLPQQRKMGAPTSLQRPLRTGAAVTDQPILVAKDGTKRTITNHAAPMHDAEDRVTGTVLVFRETVASNEELSE